MTVAGSVEPELYRSGRRKRSRRRRFNLIAALVGVAVAVTVVVAPDWGLLAEKYADLDRARDLFPDIVTTATKNTLVYTTFSFIGGLLLGVSAALLRMSSLRAYRWIAAVYIEVFRGLPALLTIVLVGLITPVALQFQFPEILGVPTGGIVALSLVAGAYLAETVRAGIEAVPKGQIEAARSLGMTHTTTLWRVVMPQAIRIIVPPLTNELVLLLKDTSLLAVLGVTIATKELTQFGQDAANQGYNATPLLAAGLMYLMVTIPLTRLVAYLERRNKVMR
ncbi:MAG: amino acid ABC transporter permease [Acidimicrobiales bacterium]|nr:amino acid ABC transporter permease [Acidimicrobiales bacterium]